MNPTDDYRINYITNNAEGLLEQKLLGWSHRKVEPVSSPFNVERVVEEVIRSMKIPIGKFICPRPTEPYDAEIVLKMRQLNGIYGELNVLIRKEWDKFV